MAKRSAGTPRYKVRSALRKLWLTSRERSEALKNAGRSCEECGKKASVAKGREVKIEVHHMEGAKMEKLIDRVYNDLLCSPELLMCLCPECHDKLHGQRENNS